MASSGQEYKPQHEEKSCSEICTATANLFVALTSDTLIVPQEKISNNVINASGNSTVVIDVREGPPPPELINWDLLVKESSDVIERQITEVLQNEIPKNPNLIGALETLINISENLTTPKPNILQLVFQVMQRNPKDLQIQRASIEAIDCLKSHLSSTFYTTTRVEIVKETLLAVERFKHDDVINNFAGNIINDLWQCFKLKKIEPVKAVSFTMHSLCNFPDDSIQKTSLQLLSKIIEIPGNHLNEIGKDKTFWDKVFQVIQAKHKANIQDDELQTFTRILKIISFEVSIRYRIIYESKLDFIVCLLNKCTQNDIIANILGVIEQVGRQDEGARSLLMKPFILQLLKTMRNEDIAVGYSSTAILFNLITNEETSNKLGEELKRKVISSIRSAVYQWKLSEEPLVKPDSLKHLIKVLQLESNHGLQLFVAWTLNHLWTIDPDIYTAMLKEENLVQDLQRCEKSAEVYDEMKYYLKNVSDIVTKISTGDTPTKNSQMSIDAIYHALKNNVNDLTLDEVKDLHSQLNSHMGPCSLHPRIKKILTDACEQTGSKSIFTEYLEKLLDNPMPSTMFEEMMRFVIYTVNNGLQISNAFNEPKWPYVATLLKECTSEGQTENVSLSDAEVDLRNHILILRSRSLIAKKYMEMGFNCQNKIF